MKINVSEWKEFYLKDLFKIKLADGDIQAKKANEGIIPLVSSGMTKNGICKYIEPQKSSTLNSAGTITVDMFGKAFYQENDYYAVSHGRINILEPLIPLSRFSALYIASIIEKTVSPSSSFTEMCSSTVLNNLKIRLPALVNGDPDLAYMESYIKNLENKIKKDLSALTVKRKTQTKINTSEWKEFEIGDFFEKIETKHLPYKVTDLKNKHDDTYNLPALTSGTSNQGLSCFVPRNESTVLRNCLSVASNGDAGTVFYQSNEFTVLQDAYAIQLKDSAYRSKEIYLFLATILSKSIKSNHNWNNKANWNKVKTQTILFPVTPSGTPDFDYMESYIKNLETVSRKNLNNLASVINQ